MYHQTHDAGPIPAMGDTMVAYGKFGTFSYSEIMSWNASRIRDEIDDQERWIREARLDGLTSSDLEAAYEFLNNLRKALAAK